MSHNLIVDDLVFDFNKRRFPPGLQTVMLRYRPFGRRSAYRNALAMQFQAVFSDAAISFICPASLTRADPKPQP